MPDLVWIRWLETLTKRDVAIVGGKNASLGELLQALAPTGVRVPGGFATTADAYWALLDTGDLRAFITAELAALEAGERPLHVVGAAIRERILTAELPPGLVAALTAGYAELSARLETDAASVAVRSSATAEDLPEASFAGQQESFLNIVGLDPLMQAVRECYASLFTDRAISYREAQGFEHMQVALSVGIQQMVRSDQASAGVMFTLHPESGFPRLVVINGAWGLGENVVKGSVTPDEWGVFKPLLDEQHVPILYREIGAKQQTMVYGEGDVPTVNTDTPPERRAQPVLGDEQVLQLARWAVAIETHYGLPMDIEWARDGADGPLYIVQARPETVQSRKGGATMKTYTLEAEGTELARGMAIGEAIASGPVCCIATLDERDQFVDGGILVTGMTEPDWVPLMRRASAIVTDRGGRTCHAAIVSRELGLAAVVGTGDGTKRLTDGASVTVSCAEGDQGVVYEGALPFRADEIDLEHQPTTKTKLMLNIASPAAALRWWRLPADGIGLARMEFIINNSVQIHPMALVTYDDLADEPGKREIARLTAGYDDKTQYFVDKLASGIAQIAASRWPDPVIVRMSDFKTNEYAHLIGGELLEPHEENPMLGWRGAARYYHPRYKAGFMLECAAIRHVREVMGLDNVVVMIPFCRTPAEADRVEAVMAEAGLARGEHGLKVYVMCEIPSNVILAAEFAKRFDGFSIGSNDLTQLTLGIDRDSSELQSLFDERDPAVVWLIRKVITDAHAAGCPVGICGQAPSDHPEFAELLIEAGIDTISLTPDSLLGVRQRVAELEAARGM